LTEQNIAYEAHDLIRQAESEGQKIIVRLFENREPHEIRYLAKQIIESSNVWAFFGLKSEKALLFFARPEQHSYNLNELVKQVAHLIEGKGGGRPNFVEVGGTRTSSLDEALQSARLIVENTILK
jgi:alanyl-tRNA synthetase